MYTFWDRVTEALKFVAFVVVVGFFEPINIDVGLFFFRRRLGMASALVALGVNTHGYCALHVFENAFRDRVAETLELGWLFEPVDVNVRLVFRLRLLIAHIVTHAFFTVFGVAHRLDILHVFEDAGWQWVAEALLFVRLLESIDVDVSFRLFFVDILGQCAQAAVRIEE